MNTDEIAKTDVVIAKAVRDEFDRQMLGLEMIPSENYASKAVLEALGSVFNNKYSEGYPHKRYYGGNEFVDVVEDIAIARAKQLFGAEHANVQPYSGSPANQAIYFAFLQTGEKVMGMHLYSGGHLTHGWKVNFSGTYYNAVQYGVSPETHLIDPDEIRKLAEKEKPKMMIIGATAYPRKYPFREFQEIAKDVGARAVADISHVAGLVVAGEEENPTPYYDAVMTTTHKTMRGPRSAIILSKEEHAKAIDKAVFPGLQGGPHDHETAAKAVCFQEALQPEFKEYGRQIVKNSRALASALMARGFTLITGGSDNHLILIDMRSKDLTGQEAEKLFEEVGIYCNKNTIPFDPRKPFDPSGIRMGTPALTTRGMKEKEMEQVADFIDKAVKAKSDEPARKKVRAEVEELCRRFMFY